MKKTIAECVDMPSGVWGLGGNVAPFPENVTATQVLRSIKNRVHFCGRFENQPVNYSWFAHNELAAEELAELIKNNVGRSVFD